VCLAKARRRGCGLAGGLVIIDEKRMERHCFTAQHNEIQDVVDNIDFLKNNASPGRKRISGKSSATSANHTRRRLSCASLMKLGRHLQLSAFSNTISSHFVQFGASHPINFAISPLSMLLFARRGHA
jgi:hypothetical protein